MQYVPSRSLQEIVRTEGPLDPVAVARIGTQVAAALAAAHRAGIVHRDVKPGNILIGEDGTAKIADFGISHAVDDVSLTSTGLVTGTPAYLAPEIARGADSDFTSDVYSLGATLYMAVEGHPPVGTDSNPMAVLHRVASGHLIPPQRSGALTDIVMAMMAPDPAHRPGMVDVANRLTDVSIGPMRSDSATRAIPRAAFAAPAEPPGHAPFDPVAPLPPELSPRRTAGRSNEPPFLPTTDEPPGRSRALWPVLVVVGLVVVLGVVLGIVLLTGNDSGNPTASGGSNPPAPTHSTHRTSPGKTATTSQPPSTTSSTSSSSSSPTSASHPATKPKSNPPHGNGRPTPTQLVDAVENYYTVVPGNLDEGWNLLTPHFQTTKAQGRSNYDAYWHTIRSVDVYAAQAEPPHSAVATLVYHRNDGTSSTERTLFRFVRQDGVLKIDETELVH
jgi:serine/threonine protein kinase